ncbi:MAG TPA: transcriptional repressor [Oscillospiraceae bacterium]|nr:transcriptional repressor [Oscillospiraceae bacterium]
MLQQLYLYLNEHNLRVTQQRRAILQVLYENRDRHLETENIYELLAQKGVTARKIGLSTVYRTLELFARIGLASKLSFGKAPARYELIMQNKNGHHHLICLRCGAVQEINDHKIHDFKCQILRETGFEVAEKPMKIYGYCQQCR